MGRRKWDKRSKGSVEEGREEEKPESHDSV